ncbi:MULTISPECIES: uracil-DNA glycosylase [Cryobacterium]|uniref:Uracil-DNA glycosylase n=1 Tax=Cryobacterium breve TaxID=1259258 RepID=A0ABY2J1W6_9MICO|nr:MULTISPECIES: uracil-DNA glycosylase [Cryobacterium]TFC94055.1 uracil-DNA glycosylase [Cryobacterium sp. TmT3-12]TFC98714.1 uracil-DNA glycosylase [Cryobacterium breve]
MPFTAEDLARSGAVDAGWAAALAPIGPQIDAMGEFLDAETRSGRLWLPEPQNVFRAFTQPFEAVRVLIVGQDPYPTPGHPIGLAFAAEAHVRPLPRSLANIYRELRDDVGVTAADGDLTLWSNQGVLLLNRVLTVQTGLAGSHRRRGWETVTEQAILALVARDRPLVAILWGKDAGTLRPLLGDTPVIESAHPSPLSARRGFFGSKPFSRANEYLVRAGATPVDWSLG